MEFKVQFKHENKNRYIYNCGHKFTVSENTMIESNGKNYINEYIKLYVCSLYFMYLTLTFVPFVIITMFVLCLMKLMLRKNKSGLNFMEINVYFMLYAANK